MNLTSFDDKLTIRQNWHEGNSREGKLCVPTLDLSAI